LFLSAPSPWIERWSQLFAAGGTVLDVACGTGRHVRWFAGLGHVVVGVDRAQEALDALADLRASSRVQLVRADIETGEWPLMAGDGPRAFDAVVVTNYLWRPLLSTLVRSLAPGGVLLYETFAHGNATVGRPSRPDFLLRPGELLQACSSLRVVAYEDGYCNNPDRFIQRIAAVRACADVTGADAAQAVPARYPLG